VRTGVVIPVGPGRLENLTNVLASLSRMTVEPEAICLVGDGPEGTEVAEQALNGAHLLGRAPVFVHALDKKHEPGMRQPRNAGVAALEAEGNFSHVWFLDSDVVVAPDCLMAFEWANFQSPFDRILVGRYDWLRQGVEAPEEAADVMAGDFEMFDPRDRSFAAHGPRETFREDLSAGLACFSGNLVWPIARFKSVGGFWNEIHHGRCEDGELGLRAVRMGVPIAYVGLAQGWHQWHVRNVALAQEWNLRDVPMLNERHPWLEKRCTCGHQETVHNVIESERKGSCTECVGQPCACQEEAAPPVRHGPCRDCMCPAFKQAIFVVEEDGRRFETRCGQCEWTGHPAEIWAHEATHAIR